MPAIPSGRPSRRVTRRAIVEEEGSEEEHNTTATAPAADDDEEDDFTPAPPASARRSAPRRSTAAARAPRRSAAAAAATTTATATAANDDTSTMSAASAPRPRGRPKKSAPTRSSADTTVLEPSVSEQTMVGGGDATEADASVATNSEIEAPARKPLSRKRKAPGTTRRAATAQSTSAMPPPPTPAPLSSAPEATVTDEVTDPLANTTSTSATHAVPIKPPPPEDAASQAAKPIKPLDTVLERPMDIVIKARAQGPLVVEDQSPRPRIVITHLVLTNFKSYAGRQEVGPFHASFSSVVGPNGSGKSNVIDSLLFVFGFRASKMRQGKISALIHNSAAFPNLDHCEVAVHFQEVMDQPGGTPSVLPGTELIISRRAFKNNSSKYYMDGIESNFTTVTTLLREKDVDLDHKRFLILQGEVESIAQMKAKAANEHDDGLLEYLEDIIGTSKYKTPIEESAAEVETLNELCMEKSGRVQHVEKERNSLEDKKNQAVAYVNDENELATKRSALWQVWAHELQANLVVTAEAIEQLQTQLGAEAEKHAGSEEVIKRLERTFAKGSKMLEAKSKETQALVKDVAMFEQERVKFDEKRKFLADKRKKLEKTIAAAEKSAVEADETVEQCTQEIATRAQEVASLEEQVKTEEQRLAKIRDGLQGKTQAFSDQIAAKQKALEPWTEKINAKQSAIAVAESELKILEEKANAGAVALRETEAKIVAIEDGKTARKQELAECEARKLELEEEAAEAQAELTRFTQQEPLVRQKVSNARQKADEARSNLSRNQTQNNVLAALTRMKESGRIDGFHGRLGNLGAIDERYDVAISTACGALDNYVTDTVEAGQQCVEYLRKTNLGRGNFMCLDKLRVRDTAPIQTPENAPRLFDLVQVKDERFRPAFYHALQDTLVAADLAQANRIAYGAKRWRVVTVDGELIDKSGTMSGGGSTVKRGLMSSRLASDGDVSKEHVAKLENDRDALESKFGEFQDHLRNLEMRLREIGDEVPQLETRMQKIRLEMDAAARNLADAHKRIKELAKEHQPSAADDNRATALQKETAKLRKEVAKLRGETASAESEIKALQEKIMQSGGEKLRAQRAVVDGLKLEIGRHGEETSKAEVRRAKAEKQKAKLEKDHAKASGDVAGATADLDRLEEEVRNQSANADALAERAAEAQELADAMRTELQAVKAELDEKTAELHATKAAEIEMRNKLEENQKTLADAKKQLRYREQQLAGLVLQDLDELTGVAGTARRRRSKGGMKEGKNETRSGRGNDDEVEVEAADEEHVKPRQEDGDGDVEMGDVEMGEGQDDVDHHHHDNGDNEDDDADDADTSTAHQPLELPKYTPDELTDMSKDKLKAEIAALEERTANASVDLSVLAEYRRRVEEHALRSSDLATAVSQRDVSKRRCDDLRRLRLEGFMAGFSAISLRLKEMYQMITMGGNAELELVDSLDPFSEGILFSVMPPKKSWKNISNLSGGEKTLSSLALVFALHHYKPTPLYVMDEIDAALDFRNVSIVANYIKERTKNAQFIVISLRNNMFELASRLVGVYKVNHMTKSVTIENVDYIVRAPPAQIKSEGVRVKQQAASPLLS